MNTLLTSGGLSLLANLNMVIAINMGITICKVEVGDAFNEIPNGATGGN